MVPALGSDCSLLRWRAPSFTPDSAGILVNKTIAVWAMTEKIGIIENGYRHPFWGSQRFVQPKA